MSTLAEHKRSSKSRPYRMRKRAEAVDDTRRQITEAAVRLHTTIGPAATNVSNLAEEAGVTRATVYKHFPDDEHLFAACGAHWLGLHPPPDPETWTAITGRCERAARAVEDMYGWYERNADEMIPLYRDEAATPPSVLARWRAVDELRVTAVLGKNGTKRLRAIVAHVLDFWTWHSLVVRHGVKPRDAVAIGRRLIEAYLTD